MSIRMPRADSRAVLPLAGSFCQFGLPCKGERLWRITTAVNFAAGTEIGTYRIEGLLGEGGMGIGLQRARHQAQSPGGHQGPLRRARGCLGSTPVSTRSADGFAAQPSPHPYGSRCRRILRIVSTSRHGTGRRRTLKRLDAGLATRMARRDRAADRRRRRASPLRTAPASCTATSSPRTS